MKHKRSIPISGGQKKDGQARPFLTPPLKTSAAIVHLVFKRMGRHAETRDFFHLELDIGINPLVAEDTTVGQELTILIKVIEGLVKAGADGRNLCILFRSQIVKVLVGCIAWVKLVLDAIQ